MNFVVEPSRLTGGAITVPGDKSISHRALMLGSIAAGTTRISGFLDGEDCRATLAALRNMGVEITESDATHLVIEGVGLDGLNEPSLPLDLGNSGTAMRLIAGLLAGQSFSSELTGDESLCQRPMNRVIKPLAQLGALIESNEGMPPLAISGGQALEGAMYASPVASAQVKSAVLLAGLYADGDVVIVESAPTRDHSERMLRSMGVKVRSGETQISMQGGQQPVAADIQVPGDLSSAAFVILAALLAEDAEVVIHDVGVNPTRTGVLEILKAMGADISIDNVRLFGDEPVADITARSSSLHGIAVDPQMVSLAIDEFPALFIAAACADGKTTFSEIGELRVKESDRISTMTRGLKALSVSVDESADGAVVHGGKLYGGSVNSHGDHRVAMSFAVAATVAEWPVHIQDTDNVATSFPGFVDCMQSLGIDITQVDVPAEE